MAMQYVCEGARAPPAFQGGVKSHDRPGAGKQHFSNTLKALMKNCARNHDVVCAEGVVRYIEASGCPPSKEFYDILIHACAQVKDMKRAEAYFCKMAQLGLPQTEETYNSMINACATAGDGDCAKAWLCRMMRAGIEPNAITYGTICKALGQQGRIAEIESVMGTLENSGFEINEYFYASLITACATARPMEPTKALLAFCELLRRGLRPKSVRTVLQRAVGEPLVVQIFQQLNRGQQWVATPAHFAKAMQYAAKEAHAGPAPAPSKLVAAAPYAPAIEGVRTALAAPPPGFTRPLCAVVPAAAALGGEDGGLSRYVSEIRAGSKGREVVLSF